MEPGDVFSLLIALLIPAAFLTYMAKRFFSYREKQLEARTAIASETAARLASNNSDLEARVRVLEQIITDRGAETAAQIEALRARPRITQAEAMGDRS